MRDLESLNHRSITPNHKDSLGNTLFSPYCVSIEGGEQYAYDVITGAIITSPYVKGACERYLKDINRTDLYFNKNMVNFSLGMTLLLKFPKGTAKGQTMTLSDWQVFFMINLYGFYYSKTHEDIELRGKRRFSTAALWVGRGNAKSTLASSIMIIENIISNNKGSWVVSAGPRQKQSQICIDDMKSYISQSPHIKKMFNTKNSTETISLTNGIKTIAAVQGKAKLDGFRITLGVCDELHGHPDSTLKGDLESGLGGSQKDTLLLMISTAGFNSTGFAAREMDYGRMVATGELENDRYLALVYAVPPEYRTQYDNESLWAWANPNLGKSVTLAEIRAMCTKAKQGYLDDRTNLLTKYMNIYSDDTQSSYINTHDLRECRDQSLKLENYKGKECYLGLDLASFRDLASLIYVFRDGERLIAFQKSYHSKSGIELLPAHDKDEMMRAYGKKELSLTDLPITDHDEIKNDIIQAYEDFNVKGFAIDSAALGVRFSEEINGMNRKIKPMAVDQAYGLSFPITRIKELILTKKFAYNDGLMEYCFKNCHEKIGELKGESMLIKKNEHNKIDIVIALMTAVAIIPAYKPPREYRVGGMS